MIDYKLKDLSLSEREDCSNQIMNLRNFFTQTLSWMRCGLTELKGVKITKDNFDNEIIKLSDDEITDISADIRERTQFPNKKKS